MNVEGKIHKIGETQQISQKFQKREIVIKTEGDYPQFIGCQLTQDNCSMADKFVVGQEVNASINLRGREWTSPQGEVKYFNTLEIWKMTSTQELGSPQGGIEKNFQEDAINGISSVLDSERERDDLPF